MMGTLLRIGWLNLKRDRVAQALTFILPIGFFSIFASVFGNQNDPTSRVRVAVVDEDRSEYSGRLIAALEQEGGLRVQKTAERDGTGPVLDRAAAHELVRSGGAPVAVVLPKGIGQAQRFWAGPDTATPPVQVLADVSDPVAPQIVQGLLQKVSFTAMPEAVAGEGIAMFERYGGPLTREQRESVDRWREEMRGGQTADATPGAGAPAFGLPVDLVNVMQADGGDGDLIAFYAAGIGVMFLLFSCAGAGGTLLEEEEAGTLGRLVSSRAGMGGVLLGKWLFISLMGILQLTVMFVWGAVIFGVPLAEHVPGFYVMTIVTAAAAAAFGLLIATLSRSRAQLSGISTIVILTMSALGGSMFPRFLMSDTMQQAGLATFNAWALDGYLKVFWYQQPLTALWPQVAVLGGLAIVFLGLARVFARRWETL